MKLLFTPEALASYNELKALQPQEAEQVKDILKDVLAHPLEGKDDPQPLTGVLSGLWGRSYGVFRQLVYSFSGDEVKIYGLGKNLLAGMTPATEVKQTDYTEDEYRSVLAQMAVSLAQSCTRMYGKRSFLPSAL